MEHIKGNDIIPYGIYCGETLENLVNNYGKEIILRVAWSNEIDTEYLKKYHYHYPATEEEKKAWEMKLKQRNQVHNYKSTSKVDFLTSVLYGDLDDFCPDEMRA